MKRVFRWWHWHCPPLLSPSLSQSGQTVSIDAKCDEPTLLGNVLDEIKQTFSQCWLCLTAEGCPTPTPTPPSTLPLHPAPPSLKHNIISLRNTATGTSSIALFISPQICKISFPFSASPAPHTLPLFALCGHFLTLDVVLQTHCVHASSSLQCNFHFYFLVFKQPPCCTPTLSSCFWTPGILCSFLRLFPPSTLSGIQSVTFASCNVDNWTFAVNSWIVFLLFWSFCLWFVFVVLSFLFLSFFVWNLTAPSSNLLLYCSLKSVCAAHLCRPGKKINQVIDSFFGLDGRHNLLTHHWPGAWRRPDTGQVQWEESRGETKATNKAWVLNLYRGAFALLAYWRGSEQICWCLVEANPCLYGWLYSSSVVLLCALALQSDLLQHFISLVEPPPLPWVHWSNSAKLQIDPPPRTLNISFLLRIQCNVRFLLHLTKPPVFYHTWMV